MFGLDVPTSCAALICPLVSLSALNWEFLESRTTCSCNFSSWHPPQAQPIGRNTPCMNLHHFSEAEPWRLLSPSTKEATPFPVPRRTLSFPLPCLLSESHLELDCHMGADKTSHSCCKPSPYLSLRMTSPGPAEPGPSARCPHWWDQSHRLSSWGMSSLMRTLISCLWFGFERQVHSGPGDPSQWSTLWKTEG